MKWPTFTLFTFCRHVWGPRELRSTSHDLCVRLLLISECQICGRCEYVAHEVAPHLLTAARQSMVDGIRDRLEVAFATTSARWTLRILGFVWHGRTR